MEEQKPTEGLEPTQTEQETGIGTGEAGELREEDVTREDALDDRVPEGGDLKD